MFYCNSLFQISVVLPDTTQIPNDIAAAFDDTDHYAIEHVALSEFVDRHFIEAFVRRGIFVLCYPCFEDFASVVFQAVFTVCLWTRASISTSVLQYHRARIQLARLS